MTTSSLHTESYRNGEIDFKMLVETADIVQMEEPAWEAWDEREALLLESHTRLREAIARSFG